MKKLSLLAATFVAAFASLPATAADGTINIEGEVTSNTCVINAADTNQLYYRLARTADPRREIAAQTVTVYP